MRSIFEQLDSDSVWAQRSGVVEALETKYPAAAQLLADAIEDTLVFTDFPNEALASDPILRGSQFVVRSL